MKTRKLMVMLFFILAAGMSANTFAQGKGGHDRGQHGKDHKGKHDDSDHSKKSLAAKIAKVTDADSAQSVKMKPVIDRASKRLEALKAAYEKQEKKALDSLKLQLKPYLKDEQQKKLEAYLSKRTDTKDK